MGSLCGEVRKEANNSQVSATYVLDRDSCESSQSVAAIEAAGGGELSVQTGPSVVQLRWVGGPSFYKDADWSVGILSKRRSSHFAPPEISK